MCASKQKSPANRGQKDDQDIDQTGGQEIPGIHFPDMRSDVLDSALAQDVRQERTADSELQKQQRYFFTG
jgi:hypothetical protein